MGNEKILEEIEQQIIANKEQVGQSVLISERKLLLNNNNLLGKINTILKSADKEYERGCEDVWELVRKVVLQTIEGGLTSEENCEIFGYTFIIDIARHMTPQEALAKFKAYEQNKKEKTEKPVIGDVIEYNLNGINRINTGIFVGENSTSVWVIASEHDKYGVPQQIPKDLYVIKKTGKHIDIQGMLNSIAKETGDYGKDN